MAATASGSRSACSATGLQAVAISEHVQGGPFDGRYSRPVTDPMGDLDPTDIRNAPQPGYVVTPEDRERWELTGR